MEDQTGGGRKIDMTIDLKNVHVIFMPPPAGSCLHGPICGHIWDLSDSCEQFYLSEPELVWSAVVNKTGAEKIYIIPDGRFGAKFVIDNITVQNSYAGSGIRDDILMNSDLVYVLDCVTMEIIQQDKEEFKACESMR